MTARITIKVGTKFRQVYCDGNPEWVVTRKITAPRSNSFVYEAKIVDTAEWGEVVKVFTKKELRRIVMLQNMFAAERSKSDNFYKTIAPGSVVHYHHGFGAFVRCLVVEKPASHEPDSALVKLLKPIALVGKWDALDLPRRFSDGSVDLGYQAEQIVNEKCFTPHASNIFEHNDFEMRFGNPASMPSVDITVPPVKDERTAELWRAVNDARSALESDVDNPRERLRAALEVIEKAL